jgi:hypothetical protein
LAKCEKPLPTKDNCQAHILSNKIKKDLKALVPNSPDLRCAIDGSGRSAVAYHITDQVIAKRKMQRRILVCGYTVYFANQDDHPKERYP